jgi:hypothetical protein
VDTTFRIAVVIGFAAVLFCTNFAAAQEGSRYTPPYLTNDASQRTVSYAQREPGHGVPAWQRHASTYEEGVQRGYADVVRAMGDYNYNTSLAAINAQQAYGYALENRKRAVQAYFELREINRQARGLRPTQPVTPQTASSDRKPVAPQGLSSREFDPTFGILSWPKTLQRQEFAAERTAIDQLMSERSLRPAAAGPDAVQEVKQLASELKAKLKDQIQTVSPMDYVASQKFLKNLEHELQGGRSTVRLASR